MEAIPNPFKVVMLLDNLQFLTDIAISRSELDKFLDPTTAFLNLDITNFETGINEALARAALIPSDIVTTASFDETQATPTAKQYISLLEEIPRVKETELRLDADGAMDVLNVFSDKINALPETIFKNLVLRVFMEASPRRSFSEGIKFLNEELRDLPEFREFTVKVPPRLPGGGFNRISAAGGAGRSFQNLQGREALRHQTVNQDININVSMRTESINRDDLPVLVRELSDLIARDLDKARQTDLASAIKRLI